VDLSERERLILEALVELHVREAGPVSSASLHKELGLDLSSASIRNVLHGLEEKGLLHQPHTSAGRVPTREGYRAYVNHFCRPVRLPEAWVRRIHAVLQAEPAPRDVPEILGRVSTLLAGLSSNVGMGLAVPAAPPAHVQRIELVSLESSRMLVVVTLDNGIVRTEVVALERPVAQTTLDAAGEILNEIAADRTPSAARAHLDVALRERTGAGGGLARTVARAKGRVFADSPVQVLHLQGATEIMGQPEFTDPENLRLLVRILDHPEELESVLLEQGRAGVPAVAIGDETHRAELSPFSLVLSSCSVAGIPGFVAILGPMRMRYALALSLVKGVAEAMRTVPRPEAN